MTEGAEDATPRFGRRVPGAVYADRPAAYGIVPNADGLIAVVRIARPEGAYDDLPGGALDPGEDAAAALVREFGEETGLVVRPVRLLGRADQRMRKVEGDFVDNRSALFEAQAAGHDAALKIEDDHTLVWLKPIEAIARLRHESHAFAVMLWLRAAREEGAA